MAKLSRLQVKRRIYAILADFFMATSTTKSVTPDEIAAEIGEQVGRVRSICEELVAAELLKVEDGRYSFSGRTYMLMLVGLHDIGKLPPPPPGAPEGFQWLEWDMPDGSGSG